MDQTISLPLQQHPSFAAALQRLGRDVSFVSLDDAAPVVAVRLLGQNIASRGPVWATGVTAQTKAQALARSGLRLLNPDTADDVALKMAGFRKLTTPASVAELDLGGSATNRLMATHGKWRNRWRRAQEAPVILRQDRFDPVAHRWLLSADIAQQRQKRFRSLPHDLIKAFDQKAVRVCTATRKGDPVAAMLFLLHWPVATYQIGWISPDARMWGLHHRILLAAAARFCDEGYRRLDLGLVDTVATPGLARFKIGSGAQVRPLGGTWLRLHR